jgi:hypothetical protein
MTTAIQERQSKKETQTESRLGFPDLDASASLRSPDKSVRIKKIIDAFHCVIRSPRSVVFTYRKPLD